VTRFLTQHAPPHAVMYNANTKTKVNTSPKPRSGITKPIKSIMSQSLIKHYDIRAQINRSKQNTNKLPTVKKYNCIYFDKVEDLLGWGALVKRSQTRLESIYWREVEHGYQGFACLWARGSKSDKASILWWKKLFESGKIIPVYGDPEDDSRFRNVDDNAWISHFHGYPKELPPGADDNFIVYFEGRQNEPDWFTLRNHMNRIDYTTQVDADTGEVSYKGYAWATADGGDHFIEIDWWKGILMTHHVTKSDQMPAKAQPGWSTFENKRDVNEPYTGCTASCCVRDVALTSMDTDLQNVVIHNETQVGNWPPKAKPYHVAFTVFGEEPSWNALNEKLAFMAYTTSEVDGVKQYKGFALAKRQHRFNAWKKIFPGASSIQNGNGHFNSNTDLRTMMESAETATFGLVPENK
jgi:hypothetical protein